MMLTENQKTTIHRLRFWLSQATGSLVVLDTETTGMTRWDEVVEIAIIDYRTGKTLLSSLVKPTQSIPPVATGIHGLVDTDVAGAPTMLDLYPQIIALLGVDEDVPFHKWKAVPMVFAFNSAFDDRLLAQSMGRNGKRNWTTDYPALHYLGWRDAQELHNLWVGKPNPLGRSGGKWKYQSLDSARAEFGIDTGITHRAEADARATRALLFKFLEIGEREGVPDEDSDEQLL